MILLGLGANLPSVAGPPAATLRAALQKLAAAHVVPTAVSQFFVTTAWPDPDDPVFVNAVARVETKLTPAALLRAVHDVEEKFGRRRAVPNAPRTLDIDILDYEGRNEDGPPKLPHPRMCERAFVLVPLAQVAPEWRHPVSGESISALLGALPSEARRLQPLE